MVILRVNPPLPICPKPPFQSEAKYEAIDIKMICLILMQHKFHFHKKGFAR